VDRSASEDGKLDFLDVTLIMDQMEDEDFVAVNLYSVFEGLEVDIKGWFK
jgi:hypothetical protein